MSRRNNSGPKTLIRVKNVKKKWKTIYYIVTNFELMTARVIDFFKDLNNY